MKGVRVTAVPSDQPEYDYPGRSGLTNEMGEFEIGRLTPGQYVLVANADGKIDRDEPFGTVFYPGVPDRKQASVVSIEPGKLLNDLDIQIPAFAEMITISGQLLFADEIPIAGGGVQFRTKDRKQFYDSRMVTDSEGRFRISIPKGVAGELVSKMWASIDELQNCPELGKLPGEEKAREIETNSVNVQGDTDMKDVKLILPFPHCQKE